MTSERDNRAVRAEATTLADLLREGRFEVPWHQRYYDWSRENVTELLEDLDEAISAGSECYFLDSIKIAGAKDGYLQVNDGQQRLVTFSLVCARLTRFFNENGDGPREGYGMQNQWRAALPRALIHPAECPPTAAKTPATDCHSRLRPCVFVRQVPSSPERSSRP